MQTIKDAAVKFLAKKRIAATGVSRNPGGHGTNIVYQRLRALDYEVFTVNPNADQVESDRCYHDLRSLDHGARRRVPVDVRPHRRLRHRCMKAILTLTGAVPRKV